MFSSGWFRIKQMSALSTLMMTDLYMNTWNFRFSFIYVTIIIFTPSRRPLTYVINSSFLPKFSAFTFINAQTLYWRLCYFLVQEFPWFKIPHNGMNLEKSHVTSLNIPPPRPPPNVRERWNHFQWNFKLWKNWPSAIPIRKLCFFFSFQNQHTPSWWPWNEVISEGIRTTYQLSLPEFYFSSQLKQTTNF